MRQAQELPGAGQETNPSAGARSQPEPHRGGPCRRGARRSGRGLRRLLRRQKAESGPPPAHPHALGRQTRQRAGVSGPLLPARLPPPFPAPTDLETAMAAQRWASPEASGGTAGGAGGRRHRSRREEGAGPSSGRSGTAPGLGPAGDPRGAAGSSCVRQRSEPRSPRGSGSGAGGNGAQPPERGLKLLFPHRRGEAQCLVLYEQPSCIYSLPP